MKPRDQLRATLWSKVKGVGRYGMARALAKKHRLPMREARSRVRTIFKILRPKLSPAELAKIKSRGPR